MDRFTQDAVICREYGWTYTELLEQPIWFVNLIREMMGIDAQKQEQQNKKS